MFVSRPCHTASRPPRLVGVQWGKWALLALLVRFSVSSLTKEQTLDKSLILLQEQWHCILSGILFYCNAFSSLWKFPLGIENNVFVELSLSTATHIYTISTTTLRLHSPEPSLSTQNTKTSLVRCSPSSSTTVHPSEHHQIFKSPHSRNHGILTLALDPHPWAHIEFDSRHGDRHACSRYRALFQLPWLRAHPPPHGLRALICLF